MENQKMKRATMTATPQATGPKQSATTGKKRKKAEDFQTPSRSAPMEAQTTGGKRKKQKTYDGVPHHLLALLDTAKKSGVKVTRDLIHTAEDNANREAILSFVRSANKASEAIAAKAATKAQKSAANAQKTIQFNTKETLRALMGGSRRVRFASHGDSSKSSSSSDSDSGSSEECEESSRDEDRDEESEVESESELEAVDEEDVDEEDDEATGMPKPSDILSPLTSKKHENLPTAPIVEKEKEKEKASTAKKPTTATKRSLTREMKKNPPDATSRKEYVALVTIGDHSDGMRGFVVSDALQGSFVGPTVGEIIEVPSDHFEKFAGSASGTLTLRNGKVFSFGSIIIGRIPEDVTKLTEMIETASSEVDDLENPMSAKLDTLVQAIYKLPPRRVEDLGDSGETINVAENFLTKVQSGSLLVPDSLICTLQDLKSDVVQYKMASATLQGLQNRRDHLQATPTLVHFEHDGVDETNCICDIASGDEFSLMLSANGNVYFCGTLHDVYMETYWAYEQEKSGRVRPIHRGHCQQPLVINGNMKDPCTAIYAGPNYFYLKGKSGKLYSAGFGTAGQTARSGSTVTEKIVDDHTANIYTVPYVIRDENGKDSYDHKAIPTILLPKAIVPRFQEAGKMRVTSRALADKCIDLAAGRSHCLAVFLCQDGPRVFAIGSNQNCRGGFGEKVARVDIFTEIPFFRGMDVSSVACGDSHSAVVLKDGTLYTFGDNSFGQLGRDPQEHKETLPMKVQFVPPRKISVVSAGSQGTLVATPGGSTLTMGEGEETGKDLDEPTKRPEPLAVPLKGYEACRVVGMGHGKNHAGFFLCLKKVSSEKDIAQGPNAHIASPSRSEDNSKDPNFGYFPPEGDPSTTTPIAGGFRFDEASIVSTTAAAATGRLSFAPPAGHPSMQSSFTGGFRFDETSTVSTAATGGLSLTPPAGRSTTQATFMGGFRSKEAANVSTAVAAAATPFVGQKSIWDLSSAGDTWKCSVCTSKNKIERAECSACTNKKGAWSCDIKGCNHQINAPGQVECVACNNPKGSWSCGVCSQPNASTQIECLHCGRPKGELCQTEAPGDGEHETAVH